LSQFADYLHYARAAALGGGDGEKGWNKSELMGVAFLLMSPQAYNHPFPKCATTKAIRKQSSSIALLVWNPSVLLEQSDSFFASCPLALLDDRMGSTQNL
jgi:hypothetical protein